MKSGDRIADYRVIDLHPAGGFRARHVAVDALVRIEIAAGADSDARRQFMDAVSAVEWLRHPGMARIVDRGVLPDHRPWIASELAPGTPLDEVLACRPLSQRAAAALIRDVADVLLAVHRRNFVHGALCAEDIVLNASCVRYPISIGGWSALREPGPICSALEVSPYSAPEVDGGDIDARADTYALGMIAFRALSGRFAGLADLLCSTEPGSLSDTIVQMIDPEREHRIGLAEARAAVIALIAERVPPPPRFATPRWTPPPIPRVTTKPEPVVERGAVARGSSQDIP